MITEAGKQNLFPVTTRSQHDKQNLLGILLWLAKHPMTAVRNAFLRCAQKVLVKDEPFLTVSAYKVCYQLHTDYKQWTRQPKVGDWHDFKVGAWLGGGRQLVSVSSRPSASSLPVQDLVLCLADEDAETVNPMQFTVSLQTLLGYASLEHALDQLKARRAEASVEDLPSSRATMPGAQPAGPSIAQEQVGQGAAPSFAAAATAPAQPLGLGSNGRWPHPDSQEVGFQNTQASGGPSPLVRAVPAMLCLGCRVLETTRRPSRAGHRHCRRPVDCPRLPATRKSGRPLVGDGATVTPDPPCCVEPGTPLSGSGRTHGCQADTPGPCACGPDSGGAPRQHPRPGAGHSARLARHCRRQLPWPGAGPRLPGHQRVPSRGRRQGRTPASICPREPGLWRPPRRPSGPGCRPRPWGHRAGRHTGELLPAERPETCLRMTSIPPLQAPKRPREASEATAIGSLGAMRLANAGQALPTATTPQNPTPNDGGFDLKDMQDMQEILAMISALNAKADRMQSRQESQQGDVEALVAPDENMRAVLAAIDNAVEPGQQATQKHQEDCEEHLRMMQEIKAGRSAVPAAPASGAYVHPARLLQHHLEAGTGRGLVGPQALLYAVKEVAKKRLPSVQSMNSTFSRTSSDVAGDNTGCGMSGSESQWPSRGLSPAPGAFTRAACTPVLCRPV